MLGVIVVRTTATDALLIGIVILTPIDFVWGMVQSQGRCVPPPNDKTEYTSDKAVQTERR
jgi:hypothetical protein